MVRSTILGLGKRFIPKTDSSKVLALRIYDINVLLLLHDTTYYRDAHHPLIILQTAPLGPDTSHLISYNFTFNGLSYTIYNLDHPSRGFTYEHGGPAPHILSFFTTVHMYFAYLAQEMLRIASVNGDYCLRSWNGVYSWFVAY
jgi:hypothetical protein